MSRIKLYIKLEFLIVFLFLTGEEMLAGSTDSTRSINIRLIGGWSFKTTKSELYDLNYERNGYSMTGEIIWEPEHQLRIGFESGRIPIASYEKFNIPTEQFGRIDTKISLYAFPVLLLFKIEKWNIELSTGVGAYYLFSSVESDQIDSSFYSHEWDMGFSLSASYIVPVFDIFEVGFSGRLYHIAERKEVILSPAVFINYKLFNW